MKVIYHLGVHCTDDEKIVTCLVSNADLLAREGIVVPEPERYRAILRDTMNATRGTAVSHDTQETLLDAVMDQDEAERLIFSNQAFLCKRQKVLGDGVLYPMAGEKAEWMAGLFPDHQIEFHLAIRNPATFVPCLFQREKELGYEAFIEGTEPHALRWSEMIARLGAAVPHAQVTVWCDEDTPLIWPEVLRAVAGHDPATHLRGIHDILAPIMTADGLGRLIQYLESHPPQTVTQRRRIVSAFLDKYAIDNEIEIELDLPGWDNEYVELLTETYDRDIAAVARIPNVTLILP